MSSKKSFCRPLKNMLRVWDLMWKKCPQRFIFSFLYNALNSAIPYVSIWFSAQFINELAGARNMQALQKWVIWILASNALLFLASSILKHIYNRYESATEFNEERITQEKYLDMDFIDADSQKIFDLNAQIRQSRNFRGVGIDNAMKSFDNLFTSIFKIAGGIGLSVSLFTSKVTDGSFAFLNNPFISVVLFAFMVAMTFLSSACENKSMSYWDNGNDEGTFGNRVFSFFFKLIAEKKRALDNRIYNQESNFKDFFVRRDNVFSVNGFFAKLARGPMGLFSALAAVISRLLLGLIYVFVCAKAWGGAFGIGSVTQYIGACTALFVGVSDLVVRIGIINENSTYLDLLFSLLDTPNNMKKGSMEISTVGTEHEIEFKNVSFKYPGSETYALKNVSLKFKVGKKVAIVGENGSGKTTFIKLLCRLYDPDEGMILLDGVDIKDYNYNQYMNLFSIVFQDFQLLAFPLGQNVACSREYDAQKVESCLEKAGFGARLHKLPKGLDTYLYKNMDKEGVDVSGGEAQKIAIARALYKDAPFVILDEPTAALDPLAEAEIYSKFDSIVGDKTAVYISHRLSSCRFCDEIVVFDAGHIVQQGTHEDLVNTEGKYQQLWHAQAQYYE
jgi:ATP-binding cassette, subfamily B, bacterial